MLLASVLLVGGVGKVGLNGDSGISRVALKECVESLERLDLDEGRELDLFLSWDKKENMARWQSACYSSILWRYE